MSNNRAAVPHTDWLKNTHEVLVTQDGKEIEIWEFQHQEDDAVLSAWAKHFRNHYCLDKDIDILKNGTGYSRSEYLINLKFPDSKDDFGPATRSGDFGEILVADYLEYVLGYWVPRTRYEDKAIRNESEKGCDIVGFKMFKEGEYSPQDILMIFESKAQFSGKKPKARLQDAICDSVKDVTRLPETLNAIKQRLHVKGQSDEVNKIARFQNITTKPYQESYGAVALFSSNLFDSEVISESDTSKIKVKRKRQEVYIQHPKKDKLTLIVIQGKGMMPLVHKLYKRAADEAEQ